MNRAVLRFGGFGVALGICGTALAATFVLVSQTNLVVNRVNQSGLPFVPTAAFVDEHLQNPWGIVTTEAGLVFVADNGTSFWTVYDTRGNLQRTIGIPGAGGLPLSASPTGLVRNVDDDAFEIPADVSSTPRDRPSLLLSASEDGTVAGWNPAAAPTLAFVLLDSSSSNTTCALGSTPSAVYKGLAIVGKSRGEHREARLFLTNFACKGQVDVYDEDFGFLFSFNDPHPPPLPQPPVDAPKPGSFFAPFNVAVVDDRIFVSFAVKEEPTKKDEKHCVGCGYVAEVDRNGNVKSRLVANDTLNAPWAMLRAPDGFGPFSGQLLVGNFGSGKINAYNPATGIFLGRFSGQQTNCPATGIGNQFCVDGLWGLAAGQTRDTRRDIFFAAGLNEEADGLMGTIERD